MLEDEISNLITVDNDLGLKFVNDNSEVFGFVVATIEALDTNDPVLPIRLGPKNKEEVLTPLCFTCAKLKLSSKCEHSLNQRILAVNTTIAYLNYAIRMKKVVVKRLHEVW